MSDLSVAEAVKTFVFGCNRTRPKAALFLIIGGILSVVVTTKKSDLPADAVPVEHRPSRELAPYQVVERQLNALQLAAVEDAAIDWCYRAAVGSVDEF